MNLEPSQKIFQRALTLVEVLLIVAIICVLAGFLMPMMSSSKIVDRWPLTYVEMKQIASAISAYEAEYGHLPWVISNTNEDVTLGIDPTYINGFQKVSGTSVVISNSDLMVILMDIDKGVNAGHKMNPQQHRFFDTKMAKDSKEPGLGPDYQFRDPWGSPYIISLDANQDGRTRDAFYASPLVSSKADNAGISSGLTDNDGAYELKAEVMIWSLGPDGKADASIPADAAINKDNILD